MREIRSGSSTRRVVRAAVTVLIVNVFAVLFLWDGFIRYPVANAVQLARTLGVTLPVPPPMHPELNAEGAATFLGSWQKGSAAELLVQAWGEPAIRHEGVWYFLGGGGHLAAKVTGVRVESVNWQGGIHSDQDLMLQRVIGAVLAVIGVVCVVNLIRAVMSFATLSEDGLHVSGRRLVTWEAMEGVELIPNDKFRRIALIHTVEGKKNALLLDDYVIRDRDAIVAAICERKGYLNPIVKA